MKNEKDFNQISMQSRLFDNYFATKIAPLIQGIPDNVKKFDYSTINLDWANINNEEQLLLTVAQQARGAIVSMESIKNAVIKSVE